MTSTHPSTRPEATDHAGTFDLRNVIATLLGLYGVVLVACYFFLDPGVDQETGALKAAGDNLWTGLALIVTACVFAAWAKWRPIVVDESALQGAVGAHDGATR